MVPDSTPLILFNEVLDELESIEKERYAALSNLEDSIYRLKQLSAKRIEALEQASIKVFDEINYITDMEAKELENEELNQHNGVEEPPSK